MAPALVTDALRSGDPMPATGFSDQTGIDDLAGFRDYRAGDAPGSSIGAASPERNPCKPSFFRPVREDHWLDWSDFGWGSDEQKLSWLCWLALQYHGRSEEFGLRLPNSEVPMAGGDRQRELVLRSLALYGIGEAGTT